MNVVIHTLELIHAMLTAVISPCYIQVSEIEAPGALGEKYVLIMSARIKI